MKVAITGANGFVGSRLVADFAARGDRVRAAARRDQVALPEGARHVDSPDLDSDANWYPVVDGMDVVVHCAARVHVMHDTAADPLDLFRRVNVAGTATLARQAGEAGVRRFILISSIKVNGEQSALGRPFRADDAPAPADPYAIAKAEAEAIVQEIGLVFGMETVIIRPVLIYGEGVGANFAALLDAVARRLPLPLGTIDNRRSLLFVGNLADLVMRAADHPGAPGAILLASDGQDLSTPALLRAVGRAMERRALLLPFPPAFLAWLANLLGRRAAADRLVRSLQVDISGTRARLGWTPPFSVAQGLAETVRR